MKIVVADRTDSSAPRSSRSCAPTATRCDGWCAATPRVARRDPRGTRRPAGSTPRRSPGPTPSSTSPASTRARAADRRTQARGRLVARDTTGLLARTLAELGDRPPRAAPGLRHRRVRRARRRRARRGRAARRHVLRRRRAAVGGRDRARGGGRRPGRAPAHGHRPRARTAARSGGCCRSSGSASAAGSARAAVLELDHAARRGPRDRAPAHAPTCSGPVNLAPHRATQRRRGRARWRGAAPARGRAGPGVRAARRARRLLVGDARAPTARCRPSSTRDGFVPTHPDLGAASPGWLAAGGCSASARRRSETSQTRQPSSVQRAPARPSAGLPPRRTGDGAPRRSRRRRSARAARRPASATEPRVDAPRPPAPPAPAGRERGRAVAVRRCAPARRAISTRRAARGSASPTDPARALAPGRRDRVVPVGRARSRVRRGRPQRAASPTAAPSASTATDARTPAATPGPGAAVRADRVRTTRRCSARARASADDASDPASGSWTGSGSAARKHASTARRRVGRGACAQRREQRVAPASSAAPPGVHHVAGQLREPGGREASAGRPPAAPAPGHDAAQVARTGRPSRARRRRAGDLPVHEARRRAGRPARPRAGA